MLLENALGGNCKTALVANIGPSSDNASESLNTIRFAARATHINNCVEEETAEMLELNEKEEMIIEKKKIDGFAFDAHNHAQLTMGSHSISVLGWLGGMNPPVLLLHH